MLLSQIIVSKHKKESEKTMKKTKIVCTMGPNSNDLNVMRKLVQGGMDIARFNFSHGNHEEQKERMDALKKIRKEEGKHILSTSLLFSFFFFFSLFFFFFLNSSLTLFSSL